jgi:hypothetical protein
MNIKITIPVCKPDVGVLELSTNTTRETVIVRIGEASATVDRKELSEALALVGGFFPAGESLAMGPPLGIYPRSPRGGI